MHVSFDLYWDKLQSVCCLGIRHYLLWFLLVLKILYKGTGYVYKSKAVMMQDV